MAATPGFPDSKPGEARAPENLYQTALERLAPLEPLLAGFNRRNKSQHRRARWWASFDMLRRGLTKFLLELAAAATSRAANSPETLGAASSGKNKSGMPPKKKKKYEDQFLVDRANERARWLRDVLLQKCYLQFSQLTADNQFATLGVVLLGVLGQVKGGCCGVVGDPVEEAGKEEETIAVATADGGVAGKGEVMGGKISRESVAGGSVVPRDGLAIRQGGGEGGVDGGGVISREDAAARTAILRQKRGSQEDSPAAESDDEHFDQRTKSVKPAVTKRKRDEENPSSSQKQTKMNTVSHDSSDDTGSIVKDETQTLDQKKTEKKPDDISAIFSNASSRPSKKIKRPVKEEGDCNDIDNIFASTAATKNSTKSKDKVKLKASEEGGPVDEMKKSKKKKKKAGKGSEFDDMFSSLL